MTWLRIRTGMLFLGVVLAAVLEILAWLMRKASFLQAGLLFLVTIVLGYGVWLSYWEEKKKRRLMDLEMVMLRYKELGHSVGIWCVLSEDVDFDVIVDGNSIGRTNNPVQLLMDYEEEVLGE